MKYVRDRCHYRDSEIEEEADGHASDEKMSSDDDEVGKSLLPNDFECETLHDRTTFACRVVISSCRRGQS